MGLLSRFKQKQETSDHQDSGEFRSRAEEESIETRSRNKKTETRRRSKVNDPILPEKKRARRRLIGAVALALAAIIGLPMVLDSDPKPLPDDINIRIPSKDKAGDIADNEPAPSKGKNLAVNEVPEEIVEMPPVAKPKPAANTNTTNTTTATTAQSVATPAVVPAKPATVKSEPKPEPKVEVKTVQAATKPVEKDSAKNETRSETKTIETKPAKPELKPDVRPEAKPESRPVVAKPAGADDEAARAMAILEGKAPPAKPVVAKPAEAAEKSSYTVQAGAFSTQSKVDEVQAKLKAANIQSYTQKIITTNGEVTRVRLGPFASKEEAEKMRAKLSKLGLNASLPPN